MNKRVSKLKVNISDTWANVFNLLQSSIPNKTIKNNSINDSGQFFYPLDRENIFNTLSHKRAQ